MEILAVFIYGGLISGVLIDINRLSAGSARLACILKHFDVHNWVSSGGFDSMDKSPEYLAIGIARSIVMPFFFVVFLDCDSCMHVVFGL